MGNGQKGELRAISARVKIRRFAELPENYGIPSSLLWAATLTGGPQRVNHNIAVCFYKRSQLLNFGGIRFFTTQQAHRPVLDQLRSKWCYNLFGGEYLDTLSPDQSDLELRSKSDTIYPRLTWLSTLKATPAGLGVITQPTKVLKFWA